jgi:hypothetical protein
MSNLGSPPAKRDQVRPWLINCLDRYKARKIVQAPIRKWFEDVRKTAGALADLLYCGPPFPPGSAEAQFRPMYEDGGELQELWTTDDIARLRKMSKAAEALRRNWRKPGAPRRFDHHGLIEDIENGFGIFASKRATVEAVCEVACNVLAFIGEPLAEDTILGLVKRARKTRRQIGLKTIV